MIIFLNIVVKILATRQLFIRLFVHLCVLLHSFIHSFIHSIIYSFAYSFIYISIASNGDEKVNHYILPARQLFHFC